MSSLRLSMEMVKQMVVLLNTVLGRMVVVVVLLLLLIVKNRLLLSVQTHGWRHSKSLMLQPRKPLKQKNAEEAEVLERPEIIQ